MDVWTICFQGGYTQEELWRKAERIVHDRLVEYHVHAECESELYLLYDKGNNSLLETYKDVVVRVCPEWFCYLIDINS